MARVLVWLWLALVLVACAGRTPGFAVTTSVTVSLTADGHTREITTQAGNVRELLDEAGLTLNPADLAEPPLFTPLSAGLNVHIIRVTESIEIIEHSIPFQRRSVRNESMSADAPPLILQVGKPGLQEITVRIVYHDGLEFERQDTQVSVVEEAVDEIMMIGVGAAPGNVEFAGYLAYISGGNSIILRGSSAFPEQLSTGGNLDQRVFALSPDGNYLLYTRTTPGTLTFNSLWVVATNRDGEPRPLDVDNVLWAAWNPAQVAQPQIAYTTGVPTDLAPGWEANNDIWLGSLPLGEDDEFEPEQLVEAYPATYGWWGGNYVWSPDGRFIAYSFADEVGIIGLETATSHVRLQEFTEYNTRSDWVWVPSLSWSPDSRYLAYTRHTGDDPEATTFDTWAVDAASGVAGRFASQTGIWSHPFWSPFAANPFSPDRSISQIAFLRATNPLDSLRSSYTLWLMDQDGSNARQVYPPTGENSRFPQKQQFMAWSSSGQEIVFIYNDALYLLNLATGEIHRITQDDNVASNPTWAPYGQATAIDAPETTSPPEETPETPGGGPVPGE
ncbi:MAG: ubiquitin-like domain-containing protein [Chloroflexi bacterium]|nr:ubiquitin-like domain-containing protein [Chloroflexota bacterium]MCI0580326.1 ubiquitin-like domain-containing protein [Chloroflexota bacterium]MCI0648527.1 ubiquitin-like domain-containing protein [Chloroflexota bacterium]MCI0728493.1 ubiquitin-like domain-containing protein [Chloroflexota bacterium]